MIGCQGIAYNEILTAKRLQFKRPTILGVGKNLQKLELSSITSGSIALPIKL